MKSMKIVLAAAAFVAVSTSAFAGPAENKATAIAFLDMIFNQGKVDEAFAKYVGADYVQHNPRVPTGIEGGKKALGGMLANRKPGTHNDYIKAVADDTYAVVHTHSYTDGELGMSVMDWFKFDKNGKIIEHWDVLQAVPDPKTAANPNGMFGK